MLILRSCPVSLFTTKHPQQHHSPSYSKIQKGAQPRLGCGLAQEKGRPDQLPTRRGGNTHLNTRTLHRPQHGGSCTTTTTTFRVAPLFLSTITLFGFQVAALRAANAALSRALYGPFAQPLIGPFSPSPDTVLNNTGEPPPFAASSLEAFPPGSLLGAVGDSSACDSSVSNSAAAALLLDAASPGSVFSLSSGVREPAAFATPPPPAPLPSPSPPCTTS